jgi:hypothetical protein
MKKHLERIKKVSGKAFTVEVNWKEIFDKIKKDLEDKSKIGNDIYDRYLNEIAEL